VPTNDGKSRPGDVVGAFANVDKARSALDWTAELTLGDGIASALLTLEALAGGDLAERAAMRKLPQRLVNVTVAERGGLDNAVAVHAAIDVESRGLEGRGRVLVRASGTEPLIRVMVEAPDQTECDEVTARLVAMVTAELGG